MILPQTTDPTPPKRYDYQAGDLVLFTDGKLGVIRAVLKPTRGGQKISYFVLMADHTERVADRYEFAPMPANLNDYGKPGDWLVANFMPDHFAKIQ